MDPTPPTTPTPAPAVDVVTVICRVMGMGRVMAQAIAQGMDAAAAKSVEGSYARGDRDAIVAAASSTLTQLRAAARDPMPDQAPNP